MKKGAILLFFLSFYLFGNAQWGYPSYNDLFQQAFGVPLNNTKKKSEPINEHHKYESTGFEWIELSQWNQKDEVWYYGAKNANGKVIIPLSRHYTSIHFTEEYDHVGYFRVENKSGKIGACSITGETILAPKYGVVIFHDGKFKYKFYDRDDIEWHITNMGLTSTGKVTGRNSGGNPSNSYGGYYKKPYYSGYSHGSNNQSGGTVKGTNPQQTLNQTIGEQCQSCKGSGKCPTCNGSKVAHSFGNSYKCNVCDTNGNCPSCHGSGKASWNRGLR